MASAGSRGDDVLAHQADRPGVRRIGAENRPRRFGPARAEQAREADDLAGLHLDARVAHLAPDLQPLGRQHFVARLAGGGGKAGRVGAHGLEVAPEHRRDEMELVDVGHPARHHRAPVAHHRHPVADLIELVEPVGDEDDRDALGPQLPHDVEQNRDFAFVERRGRLVHDDELRLERHRAGDGDHLLDGGAEVHQRPADVDLDVEAAQEFGRLGVHPPPVEQAEAPVLAAEEDILRHRAEGDEIDLLIDRADAAALGLLRRGELDRPAGEFDRPASRR